MTLWLAVAALIVIALLPLLLPLLRPPRTMAGRLEHDIEVYRDQLGEVDADLQRGVITEVEAAEARREIERRILKAADQSQGEAGRPPLQSAVAAVVLALALPGAALLVYGYLGSPTQPARPFVHNAAPRLAEARAPAAPTPAPAGDTQAVPSLDTMAERLAAKLEANPDSPQDWALLGRTYWQLGRFEDAAAALRWAVALRGDVAALQSAFGEALTQVAGGTVTPEALVAFETALQLDGSHPAARFYIALAARQAGNDQAAYDGWLDLIGDLPPDNPGRAAVLAQLQQVAGALGIDLQQAMPAVEPASPPAAAPLATAPARGPTREDMQAAAGMSPEDRMAMIRGMVQGLAERLEEEPDDVDGWARLGRAYGVLGEREKAVEAYRRAAALMPPGSPALRQIEQAIQALGS